MTRRQDQTPAGAAETPAADSTAPKEKRDPLLVAAIVRAFKVVDSLADATTPPTLREISEETGLTFQSVQRITNALSETGYLHKDPRHKSFRFSQRALDLQYNYLSTNTLLKAAWPVLMTLREQTRLRVSLCVLDGTEIVYLLRLASDPQDFQTALIGRQRSAPLTAGGLAILSALPPETRREIVMAADLTPLTLRSVTEPEEILSRLETCAKDGFCIADQEVRAGEISAAVPLAPIDGQVSHAIVVSGPSEGTSPELLRPRVIPLLQKAGIALDRS